MIVPAALLIASAYLVGSIPTAYLAGRWLRGLDLRRFGSGTVSASMIWEHVARWAVVPVGLFDVGKATLATWLGLQLDLGEVVAVTAGLAAVAGHNWPVFLGFTGGRGLSGFLGILAIVFPWGTLWMLGFLLIGWLLGDSTMWTLAALASLPLISLLVEGPAYMPLLAAVMLGMTFAKRLEANRRPLPPPGPDRRRVLWLRLLFDRDIASHEAWIRRTPPNE